MDAPQGSERTEVRPRRGRRRPLAFLIGGTFLSLLVGASFAATISINGDDEIEFGQGQETVGTCVTSAEPNLTSGYDGTNFNVTRVTLTIPDDCADRWVRIGLWDGSIPLDYLVFHATAYGDLSGATEITLDSLSGTCTTAAACGPAAGTNYGLGAGIDASLVDNFTVESYMGEPI